VKLLTDTTRILFLTSEAAPLVKIGGLGDVSGSLPAAIQNFDSSVDIRLALPFYPSLDLGRQSLEPTASFTIAHREGAFLTEVFETELNGITTYLISGPPVETSPAVYSGDNFLDGSRFTFFSLAAMALARSLKWRPDILHAHDWHASPAVYNLSLIREHDEFYHQTKSLLTVHNLPYLGYDTGEALARFGLPSAQGSPLPYWAEHLPLPLGLLTADKINTVSEGYAQEMLTPEYGSGLENFLRTRQEDLSGILNGLNLDRWNPAADPNLKSRYSVNTLAARAENKTALLDELGLNLELETPLIAMINRMDHQKGVDLVPDALRAVLNHSWQSVILGTGDPALEESARLLDQEFPRIRSILRYDAGLARRIYAGADLILIPSRYEPCGLTQMIAMRYGCIPVARATGGLKDTIEDYHHGSRPRSTGFLFQEASAWDLAACLKRALDVYYDKRRWQGLQRRGMKQDFSWEKSAQDYIRLYEMINIAGPPKK
jgi:starch synthase